MNQIFYLLQHRIILQILQDLRKNSLKLSFLRELCASAVYYSVTRA
jgi:hypothetical protein